MLRLPNRVTTAVGLRVSRTVGEIPTSPLSGLVAGAVAEPNVVQVHRPGDSLSAPVGEDVNIPFVSSPARGILPKLAKVLNLLVRLLSNVLITTATNENEGQTSPPDLH